MTISGESRCGNISLELSVGKKFDKKKVKLSILNEKVVMTGGASDQW